MAGWTRHAGLANSGAAGSSRQVGFAYASAVILCAALLAWPAAALAGDASRGAQLWGKCKTCHTIEKGGRTLVGPNLHGMFGRKAGAVAGYKYSPALLASGVVWTDQTIDSYLAATQDFMPGSKMYGGLAIPADRADLIAWMKQVGR